MRMLLYAIVPLIFLAAAIVVYALTLPACAALPVFGEIWPGYCPAKGQPPALQALDREDDRRRALEAEIRMLELEFAGLGPCPVAPAAPEVPDNATLNRERWEQQDITMMEGCWILDSDFTLYDVRTGEPAPVTSWRVCFDANGHGQQTLKFSNGFQCHSAIAAKFRNAQELALDDMQDVPCNNSKRILRSMRPLHKAPF